MVKNGERPLDTEEQAFFRGLYQDHYRALFSYAFHLGIGREAAEDCAQEAFLVAIRHIEDIRSSPNPRGYLQQVLKYVIGYQLRCMRYAVSLQQKLLERESRREDGFSSDETSPETLFSGAVGDGDLELLIRFYLENRPQKELAEELGISLNACKKRIQRAKERLRRALEEAEGEDPAEQRKDPGGGTPQRRAEKR